MTVERRGIYQYRKGETLKRKAITPGHTRTNRLHTAPIINCQIPHHLRNTPLVQYSILNQIVNEINLREVPAAVTAALEVRSELVKSIN